MTPTGDSEIDRAFLELVIIDLRCLAADPDDSDEVQELSDCAEQLLDGLDIGREASAMLDDRAWQVAQVVHSFLPTFGLPGRAARTRCAGAPYQSPTKRARPSFGPLHFPS